MCFTQLRPITFCSKLSPKNRVVCLTIKTCLPNNVEVSAYFRQTNLHVAPNQTPECVFVNLSRTNGALIDRLHKEDPVLA